MELVARCRETREHIGHLGTKVTITCDRDFHANPADPKSCREALDEIMEHQDKRGHQVELLKALPVA